MLKIKKCPSNGFLQQNTCLVPIFTIAAHSCIVVAIRNPFNEDKCEEFLFGFRSTNPNIVEIQTEKKCKTATKHSSYNPSRS